MNLSGDHWKFEDLFFFFFPQSLGKYIGIFKNSLYDLYSLLVWLPYTNMYRVFYINNPDKFYNYIILSSKEKQTYITWF